MLGKRRNRLYGPLGTQVQGHTRVNTTLTNASARQRIETRTVLAREDLVGGQVNINFVELSLLATTVKETKRASLENITSFYLCYFTIISTSFNLYKNVELSRNQIGRGGVRSKKGSEKFTVVCSPFSTKP